MNYPHNLLNDIGIELETLPNDFYPTLHYILQTIADKRDARIILMRYRDGKSYEEIGNEYSLSRQRVNVIIDGLIRKMQTQENRDKLIYGMKEYMEVVLQSRVNHSNAVIALAVISWPKYARVARGQTLALKNSDFIAAARLAGDTSAQMILRHILPNILGPILVTAMLDIGTMMMELAGLSFLGLGAQPPMAEWGNMMSGGRSMLQTYPWLVLSPGVAIFLTVVTFNLLGDTVRDYLDPKNAGSQ